jgi:hypothetical protein
LQVWAVGIDRKGTRANDWADQVNYPFP